MARFTDITLRTSVSGTDFDFSHHHPLDHSILRCDARWAHAQLWWNYSGEEGLIGATIGTFSRATLCRISRHWMLPTLDLDAGTHGMICAWCAAT